MPIILKEHAQLWKPRTVAGISLFKAQFRNFAYTRHVHREFALGVIEYGTEKFFYRGQTYFAPSSAVVTVNPDEIHDGQAATDAGFQYRMVYVQPDLIAEILREMHGSACAFGYFAEPVTYDQEICQKLHRALLLFDEHPQATLATQTTFFEVIAELFQRHSRPRYAPHPIRPNYAVIRKVCDFIQAAAADNLSLEDLAMAAGMSRFHFLRLFKATTGFSPHAYLLQRRIELAKALIEQGRPLIQAAHDAGFTDQSHMTRRFKAVYGLTPGHYQQLLFAKK